MKLGSTLTIPAGKMIKITSDEPHTILATKNSGVTVLVNVAERASLELSGKVSLSGRYNKGAIISSKGAVVLSDEAVVCDGTTSGDSAGAVDVSGDKASLTMRGRRYRAVRAAPFVLRCRSRVQRRSCSYEGWRYP